MIRGRLRLNGYAGITYTYVGIIGETEKKWHIIALAKTRMAGRNKYLMKGETATVPKHAIVDNCEICNGNSGGTPGNENLINGKLVCDYCHAALQLSNNNHSTGEI